MLLFIYFFLFILINVSSDTTTSTSFCLCTLRRVLEEYALFTTDNLPPRYHSLFDNDIGFYVGSSLNWKPVNNATWIELSTMINAPSGMYTHISLDGVHPIYNGLLLDDLRSAHLADIITNYRSLINYVDIFHENVIKSRSELCRIEQEKRTFGGTPSQNKWEQFFVPA